MNMNVLKSICCICSFNIIAVKPLSDLDIAMINDTVQIFKFPIVISAFLCNKSESVHMMKLLSHKGIASSVRSPGTYSISDPFPPNHGLFIIDLQCNHTFQLLTQANNQKLFRAPYRWFLINNNRDNSVLTLDSLSILPDSDVTLARLSESSYHILKIYKIEISRTVIEETIGYWDEENSYVALKIWKMSDRIDLEKIVLNTSLVITDNDTLNHLEDHKDKHIDTISKVSYVLLQHLSDVLNVSYKYNVQDTWGYKIDNVHWNGMIGDLQRQDAVIGGTAVFLRGDRIPVVDYVGMTIPTRSKFVFRQPKLSYVKNVYILPFNWRVWASILAIVTLIVVALYAATRWESQLMPTTEIQLNWLDSILIAYGAVCQQGSSNIPSGLSGRIITILMFISLMFIYTAYSANIVALLQSSSNRIQTLSDLLHSRLSVGVDDTVFNRFYFPNATESVRKAIYVQKVAPAKQNARYFRIREGIKMMRNGHFAFHMETGVGYKFVLETFKEHEKCGLSEIQFLQVSDPALAIQKNSPYKKFIKIGLMQIRETGLQSREVSLLYTKKPVCVNRASSFISVNIVDCYLTAAVVCGGIMLALLILLIEIILHQRYKRLSVNALVPAAVSTSRRTQVVLSLEHQYKTYIA